MLGVSYRKGESLGLNIVVPKAFYKRAVDRNLIKRWVREAFRTKQVNLLTGVYTVRVGKGIIEKKYHDIEYLLHNSLRAFL